MKGKKCWQYVDRPGAIKNLPPFTILTPDDQTDPERVTWFIAPDVDMTIAECPNIDDVPDDYRGLCVSISDHGNVELLYHFKNGKTRSIWGCV